MVSKGKESAPCRPMQGKRFATPLQLLTIFGCVAINAAGCDTASEGPSLESEQSSASLGPLEETTSDTAVAGQDTATSSADATEDINAGPHEDVNDEPSDAVQHTPDEDVDQAEDLSHVVFEPNHIVEVEITILPDDWDILRKQARTFADIIFGSDCLSKPHDKIFTYFPATVTVDGITLEDVGLRKKGFLGSLSETKPALKIKFTEYDPDQRLMGMKRMTLNNVQQDASMLNTCMSYGLFHAAGYPAPRCNFAHVTVNGKDLGVYAHVESVKKDYLQRVLGEDDGNLYEGTVSDFRPEWVGTFQKKTNEQENDWSDIEAAMAALSSESDEAFDAIAEAFDLDQYLSFWALEVLIGHWDGYAGNLNNYYLYRPEDETGFIFLPWGADSTFRAIDSPFDENEYPASLMAHGVLPHRLYKDDTYRTFYIERLLELLDAVWDETYLINEIDRMEALIAPYLSGQTRTKAAYDTHRLRDFVDSRREKIEESLEDSHPDWPWPLKPPFCLAEIGQVEVTFETLWGTKDHVDPMNVGDAVFSEYEEHGDAITGSNHGATFGWETQGEMAGMAMLQVFTLLPDFAADILVFGVRPDLLVANVSMPIDMESIVGYRVRVPPPYTDMELQGYVSNGIISFDTMGAEPDGPVTGHVQAQLFPALE